jgi:hypothetical protein
VDDAIGVLVPCLRDRRVLRGLVEMTDGQGCDERVAVDSALHSNPSWVMDGGNQRAILDAFFEPVAPGDSLVFAHLKHSPFQEQRTDRLLVGAARVTRVTPPPMWNQSGNPPYLDRQKAGRRD